jgi:hypothetical protein
MAYSRAKLKSNGDKASPCFRPFWIGKLLSVSTEDNILASKNRPEEPLQERKVMAARPKLKLRILGLCNHESVGKQNSICKCVHNIWHKFHIAS